MEFWHSELVERSWNLLQQLRKRYEFTLVGGWAVYLYTRALKSKDIDLVVDYGVLEGLARDFPLKKNVRLRKYELSLGGVEIDIYVPFFSVLGIPVEEVAAHVTILEGFRVPRPEVLLILKQAVELGRAGTVKGFKDRLDILFLLIHAPIDWDGYRALVMKHSLDGYPDRLVEILETAEKEFVELGIASPRRIKLLREKILREISSRLGL